jgi:hypothetical protein
MDSNSSSSNLSAPTPRRVGVQIADVGSLARADEASSERVTRQLTSADRLAWLYASLAVLRRERPCDFHHSSNINVSLHRSRLLERASRDVDPDA